MLQHFKLSKHHPNICNNIKTLTNLHRLHLNHYNFEGPFDSQNLWELESTLKVQDFFDHNCV